MHEQSFNFVKEFTDTLEDGKKVLDVGSFNVNGTYADLFVNHSYTGCDIAPGDNVDIVMPSEYDIPVENESYDVLVTGNTMEHVKQIWTWVLELDRVLKKDGYVCLTVPCAIHEHRHPVDCWRVLPDGLEVLFKDWMKSNGGGNYEILKNEARGNDTCFLARKV